MKIGDDEAAYDYKNTILLEKTPINTLILTK